MLGAALAQAAPEARVAASTVRIDPLAGQKKIKVSLRLLDAAAITGAEARPAADAGAQAVPATWLGFDAVPPGGCAWMFVVDISNPARQRTVEACAREVRAFLKLLPKNDTVMLATLARDLVAAAPFASSAAELESALDGMKADGDAAFTSLIFQNVKHALADHLARRSEARRCVVLLTDGKDETPGGPLRVTERRNELITEARQLGIPVHTLGFAEKATEANYFGDLKEVSIQTEGLHFPAAVATRQLPVETWPTLISVMHSGGAAVVDLNGLKTAAPLRLELQCAAGQTATVDIPQDTVRSAVPDPVAVATVPAPPVPEARTVPVPVASPPAPASPTWHWWLAGGVAGVLLIVGMSRPRNKRSPTHEAAETEAPAPRPAAQETPRVAPVMAALEMMDSGRRHPVTAAGAKIGSGAHNDIVVDDESVSADHCLLSLSNGEWVIADTASVNGLRVNGTYYHQATLNADDVVYIGEVRLRFLAGDEGAA